MITTRPSAPFWAAVQAPVSPAAPPAPPETRVVRAVFGNAALKPVETPIAAGADEALLLRALREQHGALRLVPNEEADGE